MGDKAAEALIDEMLERQDWEAAITAILRYFGPGLLTYLRGVLRDEEKADDVFSEISERLWTDLSSFRRESSVRTWVYRLTWSVVGEYRRRTARRREERLHTTAVSKIAQEVRDRTPSMMQTAAQRKLDEIRASLEPEERALLLLRVEGELTWREVAEVLSEGGEPIDEAAVRKRFQRLRRKVHALAKRHGLGR